MNNYIYICLEAICPLFLVQKKVFSNQKKGHLGKVCLVKSCFFESFWGWNHLFWGCNISIIFLKQGKPLPWSLKKDRMQRIRIPNKKSRTTNQKKPSFERLAASIWRWGGRKMDWMELLNLMVTSDWYDEDVFWTVFFFQNGCHIGIC